jgi:hypothetical protein
MITPWTDRFSACASTARSEPTPPR